MARGKKYFYEYADREGVEYSIEIYVEGFSGSAEELVAGGIPVLSVNNKDVSEEYLGGIVDGKINIQAKSSATFNANVFSSQVYGDVVIVHKTGVTVDWNAVLIPFKSQDKDLAAGYYVTELTCETGFNYLKTVDYPFTASRVTIAKVVKTCVALIPSEDTFAFKILDGVLASTDDSGTATKRYFETFISESQFENKSCYEALVDVLQGFRELTFSSREWWIRNIEELNLTNSTVYSYDSDGVYSSFAAYARPTATIQRRAGGNFGFDFSHKNIIINKPKSNPIEQFSEGEFTDLTGWDKLGLAATYFTIEDGRLFNNGNTSFSTTADADGNYLQNTTGVSFYPYKSIFATEENDKITIKIKGATGFYIRNLRIQIIATQVALGYSYFLTSEGAWYRHEAGVVTTPMYLVKPKNDGEVSIEVPKPPYNSGAPLFNFIGDTGVFEGLNSLFPPTNIEYELYIRVYLPERLADSGGDTQSRSSYIDYIRVGVEQINSEVYDGFTKDYGIAGYVDRTNKINVTLSAGFPVHPQGRETLYSAATGDTYYTHFVKYSDTNYLPLEEFVSAQYLNVLSVRHKTYQGTVTGLLDFSDLIAIDGVKYRIQNLSVNVKENASTVKAIELLNNEVTVVNRGYQLPEAVKTEIDNYVKNSPLRDSSQTFFDDENFNLEIGRNGDRVLKLKSQSVFDSSRLMDGFLNLKKEDNESAAGLNFIDNDGVITDSIKPVTDGFALKAEGASYTFNILTADLTADVSGSLPVTSTDFVFATDATAWMLGATNVLAAKSYIGSASGAYDIGIKRAGTEIVTIKSTGVDINGNLKLTNTGSSISFTRDSGGNVGGIGWDSDIFYVGGHPSYLPVAGNDVRLYAFTGDLSLGSVAAGDVLNISQSGKVAIGLDVADVKLHVFDSTAELLKLERSGINEFIFGISNNGTNDFLYIGQGGLNHLNLDENGNLGINTVIPAYKIDINGTFHATGAALFDGSITATSAAITGLTTNYLPKIGASGLLGNSLIYDNGTNVGVGTVSSNELLEVASVSGARVNISDGGGADRYTILMQAPTAATPYARILSYKYGTGAGGQNLILNDAGGNVGVSTTNPLYKVDVNGTGRFSGNLKLDAGLQFVTGAASGYILQSDASGNLSLVSPTSVQSYQGTWNPTTNSPSLSDGSGTQGHFYRILNDYSRDLGSGSIAWTAGNDIRYNGSVWEELPVGSLAIMSASVLGGAKLGSTLEINGAGVLDQKSGIATADTYRSVTVDTYGRVTAGTNPTTISGYGITDAYTKTETDAKYVDLTSAQTVAGIKTHSDAVYFKGGIIYKNSGGTSILSQFISGDNLIVWHYGNKAIDFKSTGMADYHQAWSDSRYSDFHARMDNHGLYIGDTYDTYSSEKLEIVGNIKYSGSLKPAGVASASGDILHNDGGTETWTTAKDVFFEELTLTSGAFERTIQGVYLNTSDGDDAFFIGTDQNTEIGVLRQAYYDENDTLSYFELSFDIEDDFRPFTYDPNSTTDTRRYLAFTDELTGAGSVGTLQTVSDNGAFSTKKLQFKQGSNYTDYALVSEVTAASNLEAILSNGNTATEKDIDFVSPFIGGSGGVSGINFNTKTTEEGSLTQRGYLRYTVSDVGSASLNLWTAESLYINAVGDITINASGNLLLSSSGAISADNNISFGTAGHGIILKDTAYPANSYLLTVSNGALNLTLQ